MQQLDFFIYFPTEGLKLTLSDFTLNLTNPVNVGETRRKLSDERSGQLTCNYTSI